MKLAEALILRADCQKRIEQLKARLVRNARVQEGDEPAENPLALIDELERLTADLATLIKRINRTNSVTEFGDEKTLSDALAERDTLRLKQGVYRDLAHAGSVIQDRFTRSEVKFVSAINVADLQRQADNLSKEYRELDARVQEANWSTELVD